MASGMPSQGAVALFVARAQTADSHFLPDRRTEAEIAAALIALATVDQAHLG
jgi:hypothetical protein